MSSNEARRRWPFGLHQLSDQAGKLLALATVVGAITYLGIYIFQLAYLRVWGVTPESIGIDKTTSVSRAVAFAIVVAAVVFFFATVYYGGFSAEGHVDRSVWTAGAATMWLICWLVSFGLVVAATALWHGLWIVLLFPVGVGAWRCAVLWWWTRPGRQPTKAGQAVFSRDDPFPRRLGFFARPVLFVLAACVALLVSLGANGLGRSVATKHLRDAQRGAATNGEFGAISYLGIDVRRVTVSWQATSPSPFDRKARRSDGVLLGVSGGVVILYVENLRKVLQIPTNAITIERDLPKS